MYDGHPEDPWNATLRNRRFPTTDPGTTAVADDERIYTTCEHVVSFVLFDFARSPYDHGYYSLTTPSKIP